MKLNNKIFQIKLSSGLVFGWIGYLILRLLYLKFAVVFLVAGFFISWLITIGVIFSEPYPVSEQKHRGEHVWKNSLKYAHVYLIAFSIAAGFAFSLGW